MKRLVNCGMLLLLLNVAPADGAKRLQWKLKKGQVLSQTVEQNLATDLSGTPAKISSQTSQTTVINWRVVELDEKGVATLEQTVKQMSFKVTASGGKQYSFDSSQKEQHLGPLKARVGPMLEVLSKAKIDCQMGVTGKITEVTLDDKVTEALQSAVGGSSVLSKEKIVEMVTNSLALPAKDIDKGHQWERGSTVKFANLGELKRQSIFEYAGEESVGGRTLDRINIKVMLTLKPDAKSQVSFNQAMGEGVLYFDNAAGHMVSSKVKVAYTVKRKIRDAEIGQNVEQEVSVSMKSK